jgi:tripeptide aminopeptidase
MRSEGLRPPSEGPLERFRRYVAIDTQSAEGQDTVPSTPGQLDLARLLADELRELGAEGVRLSESGIVYAMVPGNLTDATAPVLGFIAHLDTAPAVSGEAVNVIIHRGYAGGDIMLPGDPSQVIRVADNPVLEELIGDDIITADGTTLLGSDDKAGIAEILTMIDTLRQNPRLEHGPIAIAFTPDEETFEGIKTFDVPGFGAAVAYTVDGFGLGEINVETWNARTATITFTGKSTHPGTAKGVMVNAMYALGDYLARIPVDTRPETTEGRVGFIHPYVGTLDVERSTLKMSLRDFELAGLDAKERLVRELAAETEARFPGVGVAIEVEQLYRNMGEVLRHHPDLIELAMDATRRAAIEPRIVAMRGGSDGADLSFRGLPTPDLFTGGHNFHGKLEFNSRRGLEKSTETLVHLVSMFAASRPSGLDVLRDRTSAPSGAADLPSLEADRLLVLDEVEEKLHLPIGSAEDLARFRRRVAD